MAYPKMRFTPEQEAEFRRRLIRDYDRLIRDLSQAHAQRGEIFHFWFNDSDGRLVIGALESARRAALKD